MTQADQKLVHQYRQFKEAFWGLLFMAVLIGGALCLSGL